MDSPQGMLGQLNQSMSQNVPALGQQTSTSPGFDPSLQVAPPSPMPNQSPASMIPSSPLHGYFQRQGMQVPPQLNQPGQVAGQQGQPQGEVTVPQGMGQDSNQDQPGVQVPTSEASLIIKALSSRLGLIGKHEEHVRNYLMPEQQQGQ